MDNIDVLISLLDTLVGKFNTSSATKDDFDAFCHYLSLLGNTLSPNDWNKVVSICRSHDLNALCQQDAYTNRAFTKPDGYAGDARLLDLVYDGMPPEGSTPIGSQIFNFTTRSPNGLSVIARRDLATRLIDKVADRQLGTARVLSLACGHARELEKSAAMACGKVKFFALDQDVKSLDTIERYNNPNIHIWNLSVRNILKGQANHFGDMNLVYSLGLYDYLNDEVSRNLTKKLFDMLAPGGTLLLGNFTPNNHGRWYMKAFMDWDLICRNTEQMAAVGTAIGYNEIADQRLYEDELGNIVYMELDKKA